VVPLLDVVRVEGQRLLVFPLMAPFDIDRTRSLEEIRVIMRELCQVLPPAACDDCKCCHFSCFPTGGGSGA